MIVELPEDPAPNGVQVALRDFGMHLEPSTGAEVLRVDRKGSRHRLMVSLPAMPTDQARVFISRLKRAKRQGLRIPFPLVDVNQGSPGAPVVDGAVPTGHTLPLRGLTPGYACKEGYWLSIEDENGRHYLHSVSISGRAAADGTLEVELDEALRWPFEDGATVHLAKPMVEGFVRGEEWQWAIPVDRLIRLEFPLEEAA